MAGVGVAFLRAVESLDSNDQRDTASGWADRGSDGSAGPAERVRRPDRSSAEERESISRGLEAGASLRSIAVSIGRSASTVSREVARNGGRAKYRAVAAEQRAQEQARRPKPSAL
ncbi:helix-turn-helix domain-containing protein [Nonomuraea wenchangensis]|uniref:helix-turn-helix domain-containing protein n=1 Tax=Nonomuraea wenchangensis TaxID=568860 RepID=UPI003442ABAC